MILLEASLVQAARGGDRAALEEVVRAVERPVYNLALRMLASPADAEDATQEILIKIVTHLGSLREIEAAGGWALRVACRHLVHEHRRGRVEAMRLSFSAFAEDLASGATPADETGLNDAELSLALKEVKLGCTLAMLVCLSRELRITYVLGDVFELTETEASAVLEISAATYRQRLKRARDKVSAFVTSTCGLVNEAAPCRCARRVAPALEQGRIVRGASMFGDEVNTLEELQHVQAQVQRLDQGRRAAALMRSNPDFPSSVGALILSVLDQPHSADSTRHINKD